MLYIGMFEWSFCRGSETEENEELSLSVESVCTYCQSSGRGNEKNLHNFPVPASSSSSSLYVPHIFITSLLELQTLFFFTLSLIFPVGIIKVSVLPLSSIIIHALLTQNLLNSFGKLF